LGLGKKGFVLGGLIFLLIGWFHFLSSLFIHFDHFLLLGLRLGEGSGLLLVHEPLFLKDLVLGFDCRGVLNSIEVVLAEDDGIVLIVLFSFLSNGAELVHSDESC